MYYTLEVGFMASKKIKRLPKKKAFSSNICVRLRETDRVDLILASEAFEQDVSSLIREAISQWIAFQKTNYPQYFHKKSGV